MTKRAINPEDLSPPVGFAHAWLVESGNGDQRTLNIAAILRDAEMAFADVVQLNFYVTSRNDYATARKEFGRVWRKHCGKHYPGMAMFQVVSLFDPDALIEVQGIAAQCG